MFTHLLSLLIWLPIVGAVPVLLAGSARPMLARWLALLITIATFVISLWLLRYDPNGSVMQMQETHVWIATWGVHFTLAVDGISVALILMTTFVGILVIGGAWKVIQNRPHQYMACMLLLEGLLIGVFCATDALVFYAFFEAVLIPMYILIGMWGGPRRVYATLKLFIYTFTGSVFMLIALLYLYQKAHTFDLATLAALPLTMKEQAWLFFGFLIAFAIKVPMVPVHTWLPDAHVEAPTGGSVVLAAIMLKLGAYGFLRFSLPITPDASHYLSGFMITLSLIAVIYIGLVAIVQADMKKLVAYSSIAHMGFVTLGFFAFNNMSVQGGIAQMISHGFVSGAMFLCIGVMYDRLHSRQIADYGGVINSMPKFAAFFVMFSMANCGLPGTSGFVGEFMVILGAVQFNFWIGLLAAVALILGAAYSLWLVKRVIFGAVGNARVARMADISSREFLMLGLLGIAVLAMGIYPAPFIDAMQISVADLLQHVAISKIN